MELIVPIIQTLNDSDRDILVFIISISALALAGFCVYVVSKHAELKKK